MIHASLGSPSSLTTFMHELPGLSWPDWILQHGDMTLEVALNLLPRLQEFQRPVPPTTYLLLATFPYVLRAEAEAQTISANISGWDDVIALPQIIRPGHASEGSRYCVKAVIFHLSAVGAGIPNVLQQSGHYIACIKQDLQWYKFDDSVVSAIEVADLKQVPSLLVLESAGNPGRSSQKLLRQRNNNQINVVEDSAVGDANTAAAPSGIQSMADEKHCASATTSQRKRPAAKPMSGLEKYFRVVGRNNSNKLGSNNARASEEEPDNSEDVIDVQTAHTSNMPSRERPPDSRGHRSRSHGPQDRRGADRSQQERFSRNCVAKAAKDSQLHVQNAISAEATPSEIFKFRLSLPEPAGDDDVLRIFPDEPVPLPPINCLLQGCEHCIFATMAAFEAHCNELHGGVQRYRLRSCTC